MSDMTLSVGCYDYDRVRALFDGTVKIEGATATFEGAKIVTEIFEKMIRQRKYDVSELGMTYFLRTFEDGESPFLALPIFPNRAFRHSAIYVNKNSGIEKPQDLAGKTIGEFAVYGHDAGVWPKGILSDEYGVKPNQSRWVVGGLDWPMKPVDFIPLPHPADVDVKTIDERDELGAMLDAGKIDALVSADVPKCVLENSPNVTRLFADFESVERDYYRRTGIFPIMHTVVIRRDLAERHRDLARRVYDAFVAAKEKAADDYRRQRIFNHMEFMVPWLSPLLERDRDLLGDDSWPYGLAANRKTVETFLRYHYEQGLSKRLLTCEDIFVLDLLAT